MVQRWQRPKHVTWRSVFALDSQVTWLRRDGHTQSLLKLSIYRLILIENTIGVASSPSVRLCTSLITGCVKPMVTRSAPDLISSLFLSELLARGKVTFTQGGP